MLLGRNTEDGRSIKMVGRGSSIQLKLDDKPNEFEVLVQPGNVSMKQTYPFTENVWNALYCRVDANGQVMATLNGGAPLRTDWKGVYPVNLELECQRSGGRFRNL